MILVPKRASQTYCFCFCFSLFLSVCRLNIVLFLASHLSLSLSLARSLLASKSGCLVSFCPECTGYRPVYGCCVWLLKLPMLLPLAIIQSSSSAVSFLTHKAILNLFSLTVYPSVVKVDIYSSVCLSVWLSSRHLLGYQFTDCTLPGSIIYW